MRVKTGKLVLSTSVVVSLMISNIVPAYAAENTASTATGNTPVSEQEKMITVGTVKTVSTNLNVRAAADPNAKIIGKLPNKATVIIEKTQGKWHYITYGSLKGWTSSDYIADIKQKSEKEVSRSAEGMSREKVQDILDYATTLIGKPYKSGGSSPSGFDCSGYVNYVFKHFGISVPRSSSDFRNFGQPVARGEMLPGDIICSDTSGKIDGGISHVAIYMGNGKFIHAASGGKRQIQINSLSEEYYDKRFVCAVRILN